MEVTGYKQGLRTERDIFISNMCALFIGYRLTIVLRVLDTRSCTVIQCKTWLWTREYRNDCKKGDATKRLPPEQGTRGTGVQNQCHVLIGPENGNVLVLTLTNTCNGSDTDGCLVPCRTRIAPSLNALS